MSSLAGLPTCSSGLDKHFLLRFGYDPHRWRELPDLGNLGRRQACEQIPQVIKWVEAVPPTTAQQCVNHRAAFASLRMTNEQKVLFLMESFP